MRFGLWLSECADARCAVHDAATDVVPEATVRARSPCCARAWLTSCVSRDAYDDELGAADADLMAKLLSDNNVAASARTRTVARVRVWERTVAVMPSGLGGGDSFLN